MSLKISRIALSLAEKLSILDKYDSNPSLEKTKLAESLNISESTLRTIIVKRKEIQKRAIEGSNQRKKIKNGKYFTLEQILIQWINEMNANSTPLNGPIIQRRALKIAKSLKITDFNATNGWLDRFKKRNLIHYQKATKKSKPVNDEDINVWFLNILPRLKEKYASKDVFNATEFELCYKLMSNKLLGFKNIKRIKRCYKSKPSREFLKVLICANSDGTEKFNPLVIGKPLKPKSFIDNKSFPCEYSVKKTTSMTNENFCFWVKKLDKNMIENNRKILLIVDNYSSTIPKDIALKNVELVFFPPYITKNLQPLNLGVINVFKQYYEKHYLNVLKNSNSKQLNIILNALRHITEAWSSIQPQVIAECFKKSGIECNSNEIIDDDITSEAMVSIKKKSTHFKKASGDNKNLMITQHKYVQNSEDLIDIAEDNDSDEDSDSGQNESLFDAINAIKIIRRYLPTLKGKYQYELHSGELQYLARCSTTGWISFHT
ncbi:tigger transposable element-derived protein 6-like [Acyrthosiphon pisum]|uniref:HTH CENPB-type domain-containing protein n=1 Tax=Acyrthosiphon pisum TaxID=7029 RepID=A0A8R2FBP1_ACYPI|nr:tigger transposable element-derived protein 6-like [Acyrthosiphon pisum]|eukprot:XP_008186895.1 PREDICTED: tigger transposable element-derived protein 6-like [Acyrthosiphon pisum]